MGGGKVESHNQQLLCEKKIYFQQKWKEENNEAYIIYPEYS